MLALGSVIWSVTTRKIRRNLRWLKEPPAMHDTLAKTPLKNEGTYDVSLHLPWDFEDSGLLNSSSVLGSENIQK